MTHPNAPTDGSPPTNGTDGDERERPRRVLVTGAAGFLGLAVVDALRRRGHDVRATTRGRPPPGPPREHVTWIVADLRRPDDLAGIVEGVDAVVNLAVCRSAQPATQLADTISATENLLAAFGAATPRVVHVSSFSVYDAERIGPGELVDETSPLIDVNERRAGYADAKRAQELIVFDAAASRGFELVVVRPGIVYGSGRLWHANLGSTFRRLLTLNVGDDAIVPTTYVENCAEAIAMAVDVPIAPDRELVVNIVDDDLPTQRSYRQAIRPLVHLAPIAIPVPYRAALAISRFVEALVRRTGRKTDRLPGLLRSSAVLARFQPRRYSNERAKQRLGWRPRFTITEALRRCGATSAHSDDPAVRSGS